MAFSLTWLPTVLLGAGLKVAEQARGGGRAGAPMSERSRA